MHLSDNRCGETHITSKRNLCYSKSKYILQVNVPQLLLHMHTMINIVPFYILHYYICLHKLNS